MTLVKSVMASPRGGPPPFVPNEGRVAKSRWPGGDFVHAYRRLRKQPAFVGGVIATFAIGVGAAGAVFAILNQLLLQAIPGVPDNGRTGYLEFRTADQANTGVSSPLVAELRKSTAVFDALATFDHVGVHISEDGQKPLDLRAYTILGDYFELLQVKPAAGRLFTAYETERLGDPFRAVISEHLAGLLFSSPSEAIGQTIHVNNHTFTVLGVAAADFRGTDRSWEVDLWVPRSAFTPLTGYPEDRLWSVDSRMNQDFLVRISPGVGFETAELELNRLLERLAVQDESRTKYVGQLEAKLHPGLNVPVALRPYVRPVLTILGVAGLLILLIPCANVANLLVMRSIQHRGDLAVRRALGASAAAVARMSIAESVILSFLGTVAGAAVAWIIVRALEGQALWGLPALAGLSVDWRLLAFGCASLVFTAVMAGVWPAAVAIRADPATAMRAGSHQHTSRHGALRSGMAAFQLALSLTLLVGSTLLARTVQNIYSVDPGINTAGIYITSIHLGRQPLDDGPFVALQERLLSAIRSLPDVESASLQSFYGPFAGALSSQLATVRAPEETSWTQTHWIAPQWLELLDIQVVAGRSFHASDLERPRKPALVTANLADRLFGGAAASLGQDLLVGARNAEEVQIMGVVENVRLTDVRTTPAEAVFLAYPGQQDPVTVLVRVDRDTRGAADRIRRALELAALIYPVSEPTSLQQRLDDQVAEQRLLARLLSIFSSLAVVLAAVGLYSVVSFGVSSRRREFAIRSVLGADGRRIARVIVRSATLPIALGAILGLAGAFVLSELLESRLFGVEPNDVISYAGTTAGLVLIALLASYIPAFQVMRQNVVSALKSD